MYPYGALEFEINGIQKLLEFLTDLFANTDPLRRERMTQILKLQTITKVKSEKEAWNRINDKPRLWSK